LPAALVGVYLHGKAGDKATQYYGQEGVNAGDLADFIGETWAEWETGNTENPL
jgi:NAD(P)H-hydrate repair Nnr-like enzyme with NAD(P)H-hydrate dehydratase domain